MTDLLVPFTAPDTSARHFLVLEESPRRVRAFFAGTAVADSTRMKLLHESRRRPVYYFPLDDVRTDLLEPSDHTVDDEHKGAATYWHLRVRDRRTANAAFAFRSPPAGAPDLSGYLAFEWNALDAWFEEDDQVYGHARDPYHRVDVLPSSRHVEVSIDGETIAETRRPHLLFETGLPTRYYVPRLDVRMELLTPSAKRTVCPYKGTASYWSATIRGAAYPDIAWTYVHPIVECPKIENLISFFNEHLDITVDGERQERPNTIWSQREPDASRDTEEADE
jgi:uncharacterized protein (DUF427 family)